MRLSVIGSMLSGLLFLSANSVGESFETEIVSESAQGGQSVKLESPLPSSESKLGEIKSLIQAAIMDSPQPFSGSVILLERGKPLLELQKGDGISKDSRFVMASLSKQITATLILQAVDAGKLDLTQTLNH